MDFTENWLWPQWALIAIWILRLALYSARHGEERLETTGPRKGQPERWNALLAFLATAILFLILTAGGFFR